jgi:hypothetical protein
MSQLASLHSSVRFFIKDLGKCVIAVSIFPIREYFFTVVIELVLRFDEHLHH